MCLFVTSSVTAETQMILGVRYDEAAIATVGVVWPVGQGFYVANYGDVGGDGGVMNSEGFFLFERGKIFFGPIVGASFDVENIPNDGVDPVTYFVGGAGLVGGFSFSDEFTVWGAAKYRYSYQKDDAYTDGYIYGLGVLFNL